MKGEVVAKEIMDDGGHFTSTDTDPGPRGERGWNTGRKSLMGSPTDPTSRVEEESEINREKPARDSGPEEGNHFVYADE